MYSTDRDTASEYVWYLGRGLVVDGKNSTSRANFANHYIHGSDVFSCNCKVKNKDGKASMFATKDIKPGMELFWNYGSGYWKGREKDKLTNKKLKELDNGVLYRDCDK
jgi:SET domain-containing protein